MANMECFTMVAVVALLQVTSGVLARQGSGPQFEAGLPMRQTGDKSAATLWTRGRVPYSISSSIVDNSKIRAIRSAMNSIEENTCIQFVQRRSEGDYLNIQTDRAACHAQLGQQTGINQLNLADACYDDATISYLLLTALGMQNENNRADRDTYIELNLDNVSPLQKRKFDKLTRAQYPVLDLPYDYKSLTHFHSQTFAKNKASRDWTVKSLRGSTTQLGNDRISAGDYQKLNSLYACTGSSSSSGRRH